MTGRKVRGSTPYPNKRSASLAVGAHSRDVAPWSALGLGGMVFAPMLMRTPLPFPAGVNQRGYAHSLTVISSTGRTCFPQPDRVP
jgi:hypothetical protein